jgi:hypothetical protein
MISPPPAARGPRGAPASDDATPAAGKQTAQKGRKKEEGEDVGFFWEGGLRAPPSPTHAQVQTREFVGRLDLDLDPAHPGLVNKPHPPCTPSERGTRVAICTARQVQFEVVDGRASSAAALPSGGAFAQREARKETRQTALCDLRGGPNKLEFAQGNMILEYEAGEEPCSAGGMFLPCVAASLLGVSAHLCQKSFAAI